MALRVWSVRAGAKFTPEKILTNSQRSGPGLRASCKLLLRVWGSRGRRVQIALVWRAGSQGIAQDRGQDRWDRAGFALVSPQLGVSG